MSQVGGLGQPGPVDLTLPFIVEEAHNVLRNLSKGFGSRGFGPTCMNMWPMFWTKTSWV